MIRTTLNKAWIHRTLRGLYMFTQATPKAVYLDPAWDRSVAIYPGMVAMKTSGDNVTLIGGSGLPLGLFGEYIGGDAIDEPGESGVNATAVWVFNSDAEFEVLSPAFDTGATWADPGDGTVKLVHAYTDGVRRGKLAPAGQTGRGTLTAKPVARLIRIDSSTQIVVGGLNAGDA